MLTEWEKSHKREILAAWDFLCLVFRVDLGMVVIDDDIDRWCDGRSCGILFMSGMRIPDETSYGD